VQTPEDFQVEVVKEKELRQPRGIGESREVLSYGRRRDSSLAVTLGRRRLGRRGPCAGTDLENTTAILPQSSPRFSGTGCLHLQMPTYFPSLPPSSTIITFRSSLSLCHSANYILFSVGKLKQESFLCGFYLGSPCWKPECAQ